ncbi:MAG: hypothetical protein WCD89_00065 [Anaerocolumna sp.]
MKIVNNLLKLSQVSNNNYKLEQEGERNIKLYKSSCCQNGNDGFKHSFLNGDLQ